MAKSTRLLLSIVILTIGILFPTSSMKAQTAEVEPNENKTQATLVPVSGTGTGNIIATGNTTAAVDYFRLNFPTATAGIYENIITINSATIGHTLSIRGLNQVNYVIGGIDTPIQSSITSSLGNVPANSIKFYSFGKAESLYISVQGNATTTAPYNLTWTRTAVSPIQGPEIVAQLTDFITWTTVNQVTPALDNDSWIYDANFNAIANFGNDDRTATLREPLLTRQYPAYGVYYLAICRYNLANNMPSPTDDGYAIGPVLDFPGAIVGSSNIHPSNLNISYYLNNNTPIPFAVNGGSTPNGYSVSFIKFSVGVAPVISCPGNITVNNTPNQCGANVTFAATETVGLPASTISYSPASGSFFPVGTTTVTATATNACGTATCSFNVVVTDITPPTALCQNVTIQLDASGNASIQAAAPSLQARLNAGESPKSLYDSGVPLTSLYGLTYQCGIIFYLNTTTGDGLMAAPANTEAVKRAWDGTFIATGATGTAVGTGQSNTTTIVSVLGNPNLASPFAARHYAAWYCNNLTVGSCSDWFLPSKDELNLMWLNLADSDGNGINTGPGDPGNLGGFASGGWPSSSYWSSSEINLYFSWYQQFHDGTQSNFSNSSSDLKVRAIRAFNASSTSSAVSVIDNGSNDACGIQSMTLSKTNFNCADIGSNTVTMTVTDNNGNQSTCTATVTVVTPEINVLGNAITIADGDNSPSTTDTTDFGSECISGSTIVKTYTIQNTGTAALQLNSGAITVTGTNASMFTVSGITLPNTIAAASSATFTVTFTPSSSGTKTATIHIASNDCNEADYDFAVTALVNELPTVTCPGNVAATTATNSCNAVVNYSSSSTGTPAPAITYSFAGATTGSGNGNGSGSTFNKGTTTVTLTATNTCGAPTCTFTVTVNDTQAPNVITQNVTATLGANGTAQVTAAQVNNGSTDNCNIASVSLSQTSFTCADITSSLSNCAIDANYIDSATNANSGPNGQTFTPLSTGYLSKIDVISFNSLQLRVRTYVSNDLATAFTGAILATSNSANGAANYPGFTSFTFASPPLLTAGTQYIFEVVGSGVAYHHIPGGYAGGTAVSPTNPTFVRDIPFKTYICPAGVLVTLTVTDVNNNSNTGTAFVSVVDNLPPTITCPANITVSNTVGQCGANVPFVATASDNCGTANLTYSIASGSFFAIGTTTITVTANDGHGNVSSCSFTVTVNLDNLILPTFSSVAAVCNGASISALPITSINGITGSWSPALNNAATTTYTFTPNANQCASTASMTIGVNPLPNVAISGNTTICQGSSTVLTVAVPTAVVSPGLLPPGNNGTSASCDCPPDYVVVGIQGTHGAWIDQFRLVCQKLNTNGTLSGPLAYTCFSGVNPGPVVFEYLLPASSVMVGGNADYITWGSNNFIHGLQGYGQTISHINNAQNNASSPSTTTSVIGWYAASGNLGDSFVPNGSVVTGMTAYSNFYSSGVKWNYKPIGQFLNTYSWSTSETTPSVSVSTAGPVSVTATDYNGCSSSASTTVIVNPLPTIACPANIVVNNTLNQCGAIVTFAATATGTPTPTLSYSPASGSFFPVGTTTVTATATNICGAPTCTFTVTVNDTQPPVINCPANVVVSNTANQCGANVTFAATASDNCGTANITYSPASGSTFAVGTTSVTATANDGHGNTTSCTFTVTVNDTQPPSISCPANIVVSNTANQCGANVTFAATGSDNCGTANITYSPASGSTFAVGTTTVTATANDGHGNTTSCTFTVTVNDTQPPVINCPANIVVSNTPGQCGANVTFAATGSDNCGTANITYSPASGSTFAVGTTTVTATANDGHGNTTSCTFTVTVNDTQPPSITCAPPITVQCPSDVVLIPPTASDNCALGIIYGPNMTTDGGFTSSGLNWNQCGNNVEAYGAETSYGGSNPSNLVAEIDHQPVTLCQSINGFVVGQTYQLTFRASRRSGAPATVGAVITLNGGALSTTVTRSNAVFNLTLETFTFVATQTTHQLTFVPSSGWGGTVGFIVDDITIKKASTIDNNAPANFPYGDTTVTWSVVDSSGNTATCTQLVSVNDTTAPSITCAPAVVINNTPGLCTGTTTLGTPTVDDNCSVGNALGFDGGNDYIVSNMNVSETNYTAEMWFKTTNGNVGLFMVSDNNQGANHDRHIYLSGGNIRVRTWTDETISTSGTNYADGNWHHVAHTLGAGGQKIYVDGILKASGAKSQSDFYWQTNIHIGFSWDSPNRYFQGIIDEVRVWNVARTQAQIQANMNTELNTQANLQAVFHFNQGIANGNNAGINVATDASGNGFTGTMYNFALNGSISNWTVGKVKNITVTNNAPAAFAFGTNTVTWTATDSSGNTAICTQTVTVNDTEAPTITCPANITVNNTANQCGANVSFAATASDNCGTANVTYSPPSGSFFAVGTTTVTATADDGHGNTTQCTFTVTVNDTQPPVINCPGNIDVDMDAGSCGAVVTFAATASDNCGTATITYSPASGSFFAVGTTTVTATANDGNGNTASCTFTVTVDLLDHVNLQWPPNATICPGASFTAYGQVYEPNVTTVSGQQGANIEVEFGYNTANTNPATWSNWSTASFNQFGGGPANDEYSYNFSSNTPGTYYYTFRYRQNGCTWQYGGFQQWDGGTWDGINYVNGVLTVQSLDWANLQWPSNATICQGSSMTAYGQVYETGVTPGSGSQGAGIDVQFGYSTTNTNPSGWSNWSAASFNQFGGGFANDEYYYSFTPPTSGTYYYTFRYRLNNCSWQYGGFSNGGGSFWNGTNYVSGTLNVSPTTVGGTVSGGTSICPGETSALLTLSGHTGSILRWESSVFPFLSWDPISNNTTNYTSGPLAETTQFRAVLQSGVCLETPSATTTVIVYLTYPFYADNDDDGYGAGSSVMLCSDDANNAPDGYSVDGTDCDDTLADRHETFPFFVDADGDSYGAEGSTAVQLCAIDGNTPPESNYSVNDDDCNDLVFAINPSVAEIPFDNIDNNCNGTLYDGHPLIVVHVLSPSCGGINHGLNNTINCTEIYLGEGFVIGYRFKVTNLSTGEVDYVDTVQHHFKLTDTDIYSYGTSYSIQVAAIVNGEVQGYNGPVCTLTTTNVATTKVVNSQCGSTLLYMYSTINANAVNSAITYRFRVARADAPTTYYYTGERNLPNFNLTMLTVPVGFLTYATEYKVDVQIKIKLANITAWSQFGQVCSIFTPEPPTSSVVASQCELMASSYTQVISATPYTGATLYRFLLTHYDEFGDLDYEQYQDSATPSFTLSMFTGLLPETAYTVSVSMQLYGTFVPYDKDCSITTPPAAKAVELIAFKATAYPNPYTNNFMIDVKTADAALIEIKVYDMVGRLVEQRAVKVTDLENSPIGERYPSGVYNVVVSQGENIQTVRVVRR